MPLKRDAQGGGTEADGAKTAKYCSHCYLLGAFTHPELDATGMQNLVDGKLKIMKIPRLLRWFFVRKIPKLERWRHVGAR